jgi:hypothetical protein
MAVEDHPVHERTRIDSDFRYGCHSENGHVRKADYYAPNRHYCPDGTITAWFTLVKDTSSKECRYDMSLKDNACTGCAKRGQGEERDAQVRSNSK